jgi:hypothetical protein
MEKQQKGAASHSKGVINEVLEVYCVIKLVIVFMVAIQTNCQLTLPDQILSWNSPCPSELRKIKA